MNSEYFFKYSELKRFTSFTNIGAYDVIQNALDPLEYASIFDVLLCRSNEHSFNNLVENTKVLSVFGFQIQLLEKFQI